MDSVQAWISEHKLTSIGAFWASAMGASLAYTRSRAPYKTSVRLIHARMHAQALTLAVLSGAAIAHAYYDHKQQAACETTASNTDHHLHQDHGRETTSSTSTASTIFKLA